MLSVQYVGLVVILTDGKVPRAPAELEFKKEKQLSWSQQMGVVVSCLKIKGHVTLIEWLMEVGRTCKFD